MNGLDIKNIRNQIGVSQKELAEMLNIHWRTVQNWEKTGNISHEDYTKLCALLSNSTTQTQQPHNNDTQHIDTRPRLPITVRGGFPDGFGKGIMLSECEQIPVIKALPAYDYTMIVTGDSMEPNYVGGDEIAIRKVNDIIEWGSVYVLDTPDGAIIKRIYDAGSNYRCVSYNKEYEEFLVDKSTVYGVYKVVGLIRI